MKLITTLSTMARLLATQSATFGVPDRGTPPLSLKPAGRIDTYPRVWGSLSSVIPFFLQAVKHKTYIACHRSYTGP